MSGLRFKQIDAFNYEDRQFVSLGSVADYGKRRSSAKDKIYVSTEDLLKDFGGVRLKEALQKPLFPSRIEQNRSVRFFFTTSKNGVFLPSK